MAHSRIAFQTTVCAVFLVGCIPPVEPLDEPATRYESTDGEYWLEFTSEDELNFRLDMATLDERTASRCEVDGENVSEGSGEFSMLFPYQMGIFHDIDEIGVPISIYLESSGDWGRLWVRPCGVDYDAIALLPIGEDE